MQFPPLSRSEKRWFGGTTVARSATAVSGVGTLRGRDAEVAEGEGERSRRVEEDISGEIASHLWEWRRYDKMAEIWRHGLVLITRQTKPVICKTPLPDSSGKAPRGQCGITAFRAERKRYSGRIVKKTSVCATTYKETFQKCHSGKQYLVTMRRAAKFYEIKSKSQSKNLAQVTCLILDKDSNVIYPILNLK